MCQAEKYMNETFYMVLLIHKVLTKIVSASERSLRGMRSLLTLRYKKRILKYTTKKFLKVTRINTAHLVVYIPST